MLGYLRPGAGGHESGGGGDVEGVHRSPRCRPRRRARCAPLPPLPRGRASPRRRRRSRRPFSFHAKADEKAPDLGLGGLSGHDDAHDRAHLFRREVASLGHRATRPSCPCVSRDGWRGDPRSRGCVHRRAPYIHEAATNCNRSRRDGRGSEMGWVPPPESGQEHVTLRRTCLDSLLCVDSRPREKGVGIHPRPGSSRWKLRFGQREMLL